MATSEVNTDSSATADKDVDANEDKTLNDKYNNNDEQKQKQNNDIQSLSKSIKLNQTTLKNKGYDSNNINEGLVQSY